MRIKRIISLVLLSAFLLMMIPSIQAVEHQIVQEKRSAEYAELLQTLKEKADNDVIDIWDVILSFLVFICGAILIVVGISGMIIGKIIERIFTPQAQ